MIILGIGGILGDAASAMLKDGELVAAVEESKLVRRRTHWGGPAAAGTCHRHLPGTGGRDAGEVDAVAMVRPIPNRIAI